MTCTAHVLLIDQVADWEAGHLLAELNTGRFIGEPRKVVGVAASDQPVTTMGGLRWLPDNRPHTATPKEALEATGYKSGEYYLDQRAVADG